jgi:biopolymer transport protein ExbD
VAALNITSMMDLVLNLLLFFVLTASFAATEGVLPAMLPKLPLGGERIEHLSLDEKPTKLVISLVSTGQGPALIQIEGATGTVSGPEDLHTTLARWRRDADHPDGLYLPDDAIVIQADGRVRWSEVVDAFNALVRAKYTNISFASPN